MSNPPDETAYYRRMTPPTTPARKEDLLRTPVDYEPRKKDNLFLWTVFLLLLVGFTMCCWIGSYLIFNRPELPLSYRILRKLKKIDLPQRFKVNAAPQGEFLTAEKLFERYNTMSLGELREANRLLERNYLRNYPQSSQSVAYVKGVFTILNSYQLTRNDFFPSGAVVLAVSTDVPKLLIEQVYSADASVAPLIQRNLQTGMDIELRRTYDLTAVVHVTKLPTGHVQLTTVPINYGSYAFTGTNGGFSLEPPLELRVAAGWPIIRDDRREESNKAYLAFRQRTGAGSLFFKKRVADANAKPTESAIKGVDAPLTPPPTAPEAATPAPMPVIAQATPTPEKPVAKDIPKAVAVSPAATPAPTVLAMAASPSPSREIRIEKALPVTPVATPPLVVQRTAPTPLPVLKALPAQGPGGTALQPFLGGSGGGSTSSATTGATVANGSGGTSWPVYAPGRAPSGKNLQVNQINSYAQRIGQSGNEPFYLNGQFVVRAMGPNKARGTKMAVLRSTNNDGNVRVIVEYPRDQPAPAEGTQLVRDEQHPYQVMSVSQVADGTINVYVREITAAP